MTKVLIVEDDPHTRRALSEVLQGEGFQVVIAEEGRRGLECFSSESPDLVCLDVMLPHHSGYDLCRQFRAARPDIPILFITAKSEEIDRVVGLELGADDYIVKPFGIREVLARVRAVLRRCHGTAPSTTESPSSSNAFEMGDITIHPQQLRAYRDDLPIELSPRELQLLELFHRRPSVVLTRTEIFHQIWGYNYCPNSRTLDQTISQLRRRIERDPRNPKIIQTVHGAGYRYEP